MELFGTNILELITNSTTITIIVCAIILFIAVIIIRKVIRSFFSRTSFIEERKEQTLEAMINSIISYIALISFIIVVLSQLGVDIGRILAGAGIIGVIIGFGAQSLIKDFFAGLFLLYEEQLHKGDYITLNNMHHGTVEDIGLRFLKIREWSGKLLTISNGQIHTIENYNFEYMRVIENVTTNFREDPRTVFNALEKTCERLNEELAIYLKRDLTRKTIEPFQVYGMTSLNDHYHGYQYTITGVVEDLVYWTASKETRRIIAETMYDHNIAMAEQRVQVQSYTTKEE
ncbi:mechanosensitive ion channel family protein [Halobacillus amylolyticus]|uniref:Mechanosensitive ion channel family protein n=1 Tax=Halobacillus amylolyticus TaxID=2932259 RepID=A0ABY4HHR3_9BACI|nr:mechanosensitive ion channel family protein [Halobacillus amylolyticus]UOR13410.1 mechanosensitive ion channel family protein [Halobacillus amylolyticus]